MNIEHLLKNPVRHNCNLRMPTKQVSANGVWGLRLRVQKLKSSKFRYYRYYRPQKTLNQIKTEILIGKLECDSAWSEQRTAEQQNIEPLIGDLL